MRALIALWFGLSQRVDRKTYVKSGLQLALLKYAVDAGMVYGATGRFWTPLEYLMPFFSVRSRALEPASQTLLIAMAVWAVPFMWVGVSMTLRRLIDARESPW